MYTFDEILYGIAQNSQDEILYTLDQLRNFSMEISADSTDITDKLGNVVYTRYTAKKGTVTATNAFINANIMNAASGSDIQIATESDPIVMPLVVSVNAGESVELTGADLDTLKVIGIYGNGANGTALTQLEIEACLSGETFTAPAGGTDLPIEYVCSCEKEYTEGLKLVNSAEDFPTLVKLTLYASYIDPCDDAPKPCYIIINRFMADPSMTINVDRENQEIELKGNMNVDYCSTDKTLYEIYFPNELVSA